MADESLKKDFFAKKAKKQKYEKVRDSISNHGLDSENSLTQINDLIDKLHDYIDKIDGNAGYQSYLANFRSKMSEKRKVLKNYRDFVRDSNKAFKQMYKDLSDEIDSLDSQMHADADAYNKDHGMLDGDRIRFYDFW